MSLSDKYQPTSILQNRTAESARHFLIIQTAFLGDVVLATAVAEKLHRQHPGAAIDMLVRKGNESLLAGHPFLRRVLVWNKQQEKLRNLWRIIRDVRQQRYDVVINLHRFASSGIITALAGARQTRGFDKNPLSRLFSKSFPHPIGTQDDDAVHELDRNHALIADFTDDAPALPRLYPSPADYATVEPLQNAGQFVCIAPASVWFTKQWPAAQWAKLISLLKAEKIYLLGAPGDEALAQEISTLAGGDARVQSLCGKLSLLQSAALMQGAAINYVNDSGPLHLCTAMNAPVTAVFLSTSPRFGFGPRGLHGRVAQVSGLYCKPCGLHGYRACPEGHFRCAWDLDVAIVSQP